MQHTDGQKTLNSPDAPTFTSPCTDSRHEPLHLDLCVFEMLPPLKVLRDEGDSLRNDKRQCPSSPQVTKGI